MLWLASLAHHARRIAGTGEPRDSDGDPEIEGIVEVKDMDEGRTVYAPLPLPRKAPKPIAVGQPDHPEIARLLAEIGFVWEINGALHPKISPREFCTLPKAPHRPVAIPPRECWPHMARLIRETWRPLRDVCGPLSVKGYRPKSYNAAVGGSLGSRHMFAQAYDLRAGSPGKLDRLKYEAAVLYLRRGSEIKMGLGIYAGNIHVDVGYRRRCWGSAKEWIKKVKL